jgi:fructan beta-fructosidase
MNDPNGLVLLDGRWHAFYQHHPFDDRWGPMHWGHASSVDGVHWEHHPVALEPDELGTIFSGSVVVDADDAAGFGAGASLAFFTHHDADHPGGVRQSQSLASSTDGGTTWTKYAGNPIIPGDVADFRDPKVCRLPDGRWCMTVSLADHLAFYASVDLVHWSPIGTFAADLDASLGGGVGNWECPDLVPLADGRWVVVISLSTGGVPGHSGTVALPGDFADGVFTAVGPPRRLDHGPDCYAWQSFHGTPSGEVIGMAWANSWTTAHSTPSAGRRGLLTLPRRLWLDERSDLRQWPAVDRPADVPGARWIESSGDVEVSIEGAGGSVRAAVRDGVALIERSGGFGVGYDGRFEVELHGDGSHLIVVDHGIVEVFADGGAAVLTAQVFAGPSPVVAVG